MTTRPAAPMTGSTTGPSTEPTTGRRRQADRSARSRHRLLVAAAELLGTHGYHGATLAEIGRKAGVSRGLVTHYFGSKEQCVGAVVDAIREAVAASILGPAAEGAPHGLAALDRVVEAYLDPERLAIAPAKAMIVIMSEAMTATPSLLGAATANDRAIREQLATWIAEAAEELSSTLEEPPLVVATWLEGALRGVMMQGLIDPDHVDLHQQSALIKRSLRAVLA